MARKKSTESIDSKIEKIKSEMIKLQDKQDRLTERLKNLQEQKRQHEAEAIMDVYAKSGKSLEEVMTFLNP